LSAIDRQYARGVESFRFDDVLNQIRDAVTAVNREIDQEKPWELLKKNEVSRIHQLLSGWYDCLDRIGDQLTPFLPRCSAKIKNSLHGVEHFAGDQLFPRIK